MIYEKRKNNNWILPAAAEILEKIEPVSIDREVADNRSRVIEDTLRSLGSPATVVEINSGPTVTQFGVKPGSILKGKNKLRVRVADITALEDDLALALAVRSVRVHASVPGKAFVGIEVPNERQSLVTLLEILESKAFNQKISPLQIALGKDVNSNPISVDLAALPHLLIGGTTGSGKSVFMNSLLCGLLITNTPEVLRLIIIDPKRTVFSPFNGIPHLLTPVITDSERVPGYMQWVIHIMGKRYASFAKVGAKNIVQFNSKMKQEEKDLLPYFLVLIEEFADIITQGPNITESLITRILQMASQAGIHMVISTQRPSVDVMTGLIKANLPARIAFLTSSKTDSRLIIDQAGAEQLIGRGDLLYLPPDVIHPIRLQGVYVSNDEILRIARYWRDY